MEPVLCWREALRGNHLVALVLSLDHIFLLLGIIHLSIALAKGERLLFIPTFVLFLPAIDGCIIMARKVTIIVLRGDLDLADLEVILLLLLDTFRFPCARLRSCAHAEELGKVKAG